MQKCDMSGMCDDLVNVLVSYLQFRFMLFVEIASLYIVLLS